MSSHRRCVCRQCLQYERDVGPISKRGLCAGCAALNQIEAAEQTRLKEGPIYEEWKRNRDEGYARVAAMRRAARESS